jgi:hypothetical protein
MFDRWHRYFLSQTQEPRFPWRTSDPLTPAEKRLAQYALQQFQLGEGSDGRGFLSRAESDSRVNTDPNFHSALRLFIAEEQRHSRWLGQFLDREEIPRIERSALDGVFRRLRKLAGLELCVMVLVTAEVLAIPFYQALRDATGCQLLKRLCERILCDEAAHLQFQATTLFALRRDYSTWRRAWHTLVHRAILHSTVAVVWIEFGDVFRAGGYSIAKVWTEALREMRRVEEAANHEPRLHPATQFRLAD